MGLLHKRLIVKRERKRGRPHKILIVKRERENERTVRVSFTTHSNYSE